MVVLNPNTNFPHKKKNSSEEYKFTKYGNVSKSNIKWSYNFDPLKKWAAIVLSAILFAGIVTYYSQETTKTNLAKSLKIEAEEANRKYLEKRLETIKQETIAAELKKNEDQKREATANATVKSNPKRGAQVYSWLNEKGERVYSNKKPSPQ